MKRYLVDVAAGFGLFVLILLSEFLVTLPFGDLSGVTDEAIRKRALLTEFGVATPCALLLSFGAALALRTAGPADGLRRGAVWLVVVGALYLVLALGNSNQIMLGVPTLYLLLTAVVAGPVLAGVWARRQG